MADIRQATELAMAHLSAGAPEKALQALRALVGENRAHPIVHNIAGMAYSDLGQNAAALRSFKSAIKNMPAYANAHLNLGHLLEQSDQSEAALKAYDDSVSANPEYVDGFVARGALHARQLRFDAAISDFSRATELDPEHRNALLNLGNTYVQVKNFADAEKCYLRALELTPSEAGLYFNLGRLYFGQARYGEATVQYRRAVRLEPQSAAYCRALATCFEIMPIAGHDEGLCADLMACLENPGVDSERLIPTAIAMLKEDPLFKRPLSAAAALPLPKDADGTLDIADIQGLDSPLLNVVMGCAPLPDTEFEHLLSHARALMLSMVSHGRSGELAGGEGFLARLAIQGFLTEYVWWSEPWEDELLEMLDVRADPIGLLVAASYRPLASFGLTDAELAALPDVFEPVIRQQITEPRRELAIRESIPLLTDTASGTSEQVRDQYEENPYPRWHDLAPLNAGSVAEVMVDLFPDVDMKLEEISATPQILIAGCGTGRHAFHAASRFQGAQVTAVDLSLSSLSFAARKAEELGFDNVTFAVADILQMDGKSEHYDIIESIGTLVAMDDPLAAWQILANMLKPKGLMKIGLYSEAARQGVVAARKFVSDGGYAADGMGIRKCRQEILRLAVDDPVRVPSRSKDFFSISGTRDLIFHVKEIRFTIPEIAEMLEALELDFLGFEIRGPDILDAYRTMFPDDPAATSLENWHLFEQKNPRSFAEMYQFWLQKR